MKSIIATAAAALALAAGATGAFAASMPARHEASGRIERISPAHLTLNHRTYRFAPGVASADLKRGERVKVWYTSEHGKRLVTKIEPRAA